MKDKIRIFVQKPWKTSDSPYYKFLRESPPADVEFVNFGDSNLIQNKKKMRFDHFLKQWIKKVIKKIYPGLPNAHYARGAGGCDLIHCAHCLSRNKMPWICNLEYVGQFWAAPIRYGVYASKRGVRKYLTSNYCKKIVAWTEWVKRDVLELFPEISDKVEVVYPGIPSQGEVDRSGHKGVTLLFASRRFYFKGGLYAVEAIDRLTKKFGNVKGLIVSDVPKEVLDKYSENKKIEFLGMMPQEKLFGEVYPRADVFVYPSFTDTFGFPMTEAMSFGLPVVCVGGHSRSEIVEDGKTGFVVPTPFEPSVKMENLMNLHEETVGKICDRAEELIRSKRLRGKMGKDCRKLFDKGGKFSVERRNEELLRVYGEAIGFLQK